MCARSSRVQDTYCTCPNALWLCPGQFSDRQAARPSISPLDKRTTPELNLNCLFVKDPEPDICHRLSYRLPNVGATPTTSPHTPVLKLNLDHMRRRQAVCIVISQDTLVARVIRSLLVPEAGPIARQNYNRALARPLSPRRLRALGILRRRVPPRRYPPVEVAEQRPQERRRGRHDGDSRLGAAPYRQAGFKIWARQRRPLFIGLWKKTHM